MKAVGAKWVELTRQLVEAVFSSSEIPAGWEDCCIQNLYDGKGEALDGGSCRSLKLTDQIMKLLDFYVHKMVNLDEMQFGFVLGRGTTETIFIVPQFPSTLLSTGRSTLSTSTIRSLCWGGGGGGGGADVVHQGWLFPYRNAPIHPGVESAFASVPDWCAMGACLCWWPDAYHGHFGGVYFHAWGVELWYGM